ncbi:MAG: Membrane sensor protein UhpC, partial [Chlamydiae bacterium]|nr:Membrane sensor protein UhpC [Chlamydiota bacterium]
MSFLGFFKSAPPRPLIKDEALVARKYRYWRLRIFYSMYIGYALYYFTRKSYPVVMALLSTELGFTEAQLGIVGSTLYLSYGVSKFFSGVMSDRSNPKYFMSFGLILTGIFNILFGMSSSILVFLIFWGFNCWFQCWVCTPLAKLLMHSYA